MWPRSIILALCWTTGLTTIATAEPIEPHKVPTVTIRTQPAGESNPGLAPPADFPAVPALKVRPPPKNGGGPSVPRFGDDQEAVHGASKADAHAIRTVPIGPDTDTRLDLDRHFAPRTSAPPQPSPGAK
jgi:hypothetical protein